MRNHPSLRWTFPMLCLTLTVNGAFAAQLPLRVRPVLIYYRITNSQEDSLGAKPAADIHPKVRTGETRGKRNPT
jgi:hypothetical protein